MKNYLLPILVIVILGGGYYVLSAPQEAPAPAVTEPREEQPTVDPVEADTVYSVDTERSTLNWSGEKITGSRHGGTVLIQEGSLELKEGIILGGEFVVDMSSIEEVGGSGAVVKHLKNEDFFDVAQYPTSVMQVTSVETISEEEMLVKGELTVKDQTHSLEFPAKVVFSEAGIEITAAFSIDRTNWGIVYGSGSFFDNLGNRAIKDEINFDLAVTLVE